MVRITRVESAANLAREAWTVDGGGRICKKYFPVVSMFELMRKLCFPDVSFWHVLDLDSRSFDMLAYSFSGWVFAWLTLQ